MRRSLELAPMQVNCSVTKGWRLLGSEQRERGKRRVTYTCARSTYPDRIHLHTKTRRVHLAQHVGHCKRAWRGEDERMGTVRCKFPPWNKEKNPSSPTSSCKYSALGCFFPPWCLVQDALVAIDTPCFTDGEGSSRVKWVNRKSTTYSGLSRTLVKFTICLII